MAKDQPGTLLIISGLLLIAPATPGLGQPYDLYIGYELPSGQNQASRALASEANCLTDRNVERQACARSATRDQCEDSAEIAFRRCILSIQGVRFYLNSCARDKCDQLRSLYYPLLGDEATDPRISPEMHHPINAGRYVRTGIYVEKEADSCVFRKNSSRTKVNVPNFADLCVVVLNDIGSPGGISSWRGWNPIYKAWSKGQKDLARRLVSRSGEKVPECSYAYDGDRPFIPQHFGPCVASDGSWD